MKRTLNTSLICCGMIFLLSNSHLQASAIIGFDNVDDLTAINVDGEFRFQSTSGPNAFLVNNNVGDPTPSILANRDRSNMVFYRTDGEPFVFDSISFKSGINAPNVQGFSPSLTLEGYSVEEDRVVGYEFFTTSNNEFETFQATEFDESTTRGLRDVPIYGLVLTAIHDEEGGFTAAGRALFDNVAFGSIDTTGNPDPPVVPDPPITDPNAVPEPTSLVVFAGLLTMGGGLAWIRRRDTP